VLHRVLIRTGWLFLGLTVLSFGLYAVFYLVLPWSDAVMSIVAPVFGFAYAPALWLGMLVTESDFPLAEVAAFALIENLLISAVIAFIWTRRAAPRGSEDPSA
jgi:hypothetical protein